MRNRSAGRPLVVVNASNQRGWGSRDHLLDDSRLQAMIGREYSGLGRLTNAADKLATSYATIEYIGPDGQRYRYDGSADLGIPGRDVRRITRVA